jgi:hypothetical protein
MHRRKLASSPPLTPAGSAAEGEGERSQNRSDDSQNGRGERKEGGNEPEPWYPQ